jgi:serine phosphatase RsbU (regulator of sigma subunit)
MALRRPRPGGTQKKEAGIAQTVMGDLRSKDLRRSLSRDLKDFYIFYIDEEKRRKLQKKSRIVRWIYLAAWLVRGLVLNLSPIRRLILLLSLLMAYAGRIEFAVSGRSRVTLNLTLSAFLLLLLVLALELKDKLLARDELRIGRTVQLALLPKANPVFAGWEIWLYSRPANEVCGDMVDYMAIGERALGLTLADVSGKGLGAALLTAKLQATQRALADYASTLSDMGTRLNRILWRDIPRGSFATLVHLEIEHDAGRVRVLNAGHMPPAIIRADSVERLEPKAPPLGVIEAPIYQEQTVQLLVGDALVVYSDGLTEAANRRGEFYGEDRLARLLPALRGLSAEQVGLRLVSEAAAFIGNERPSDDLSVLVLRRVAESRPGAELKQTVRTSPGRS